VGPPIREPSGRTDTVFTRFGSGNGVGGAGGAEPPGAETLALPPLTLDGATGTAETGVSGAIDRVGEVAAGEASATTVGTGVGGVAVDGAPPEGAAEDDEFETAGADGGAAPAGMAATTTKGAAAIVGGLGAGVAARASAMA
jgi:hypothetical protein